MSLLGRKFEFGWDGRGWDGLVVEDMGKSLCSPHLFTRHLHLNHHHPSSISFPHLLNPIPIPQLSTNPLPHPVITSGKVLDYAVEKCLDSDGNVRCTKPFLVEKGACYGIEWSTNATLSHTTVEVRDAGSGEMVSLF
jgi:hypothetical protein